MRLSKTGRKRVLNAMGAVGFVMYFTGAYMFERGISYGAAKPNPLTGNTYEINSHGTRRYVTWAEDAWMWGLQGGGWLILVTSILVRLRKEGRL